MSDHRSPLKIDLIDDLYDDRFKCIHESKVLDLIKYLYISKNKYTFC